MSLFGRRGKDEPGYTQWEPPPGVTGDGEVPDAGEAGEVGKAGEAGPQPPPQESGPRRDFFELEPEEVAAYRTPGPPLAVRREHNWKPVVLIAAAVLLLGGIVAAVVLLWPSSTTAAPDLSGMDLARAMRAARDGGFEPVVRDWRYSEDHSDGVVLAQEPGAGSTVTKGATIWLTVSKGKDPESKRAPQSSTPASTAEDTEQVTKGDLEWNTVCIDPGHQSRDPGTTEWLDPGMKKKQAVDGRGETGVATGNPEYLVTIDIARKLKELLEKDGVTVVMTRESNTVQLGNVQRAETANNARAALLLSIHCSGSSDPAVRGASTFYPAKGKWTGRIYDLSKTAAIYVQEELVRSCDAPDLGIDPREDVAQFNWSKVPAVVSNIAFLTNERDDANLGEDDYRWKVAWGLRNGVTRYLKSQ